jgi:hypothetical protein
VELKGMEGREWGRKKNEREGKRRREREGRDQDSEGWCHPLN